MKPITFYIFGRTSRETFLKCDRPTRIRVTSYLMRCALRLVERGDKYDQEDLEDIIGILNAQREGRDWTEFEMGILSRVWRSQKCKKFEIEIIDLNNEAERPRQRTHFVDVRNINMDALFRAAAREAGFPLEAIEALGTGKLVAAQPEESGDANNIMARVNDLATKLEDLAAEVTAIKTELAFLVQSGAVVANVTGRPLVDRKALAAAVKAKVN